MSAEFDFVRFPGGASGPGVTAVAYEVQHEDEKSITYAVAFLKDTPEPEPMPPVTTVVKRADAFVEPEPDTSPTPDGIDYAEFPDLPDAS
jgi:hypothetical protein